jgi:hypothetical protein
MATDFREERKWKCTAARVLARAVQTRPAPVPTTTLGLTHTTATTSTAAAGGIAGSSRNEVYAAVPGEDLEQARVVARKVSWMVSLALVGPPHDGGAAAGAAASESKKKKTDENGTNEPSLEEQQPSVMEEEQSSVRKDTQQEEEEEESKEKDASSSPVLRTADRKDFFDLISKRVEAVETKTVRPTRSGASKSAKTHGMKLNPGQMDVIDAIEDWWNGVRAGTVLQGTHACGKTILACSLLWRSRTMGPQVVLCAATSLVSEHMQVVCLFVRSFVFFF